MQIACLMYGNSQTRRITESLFLEPSPKNE